MPDADGILLSWIDLRSDPYDRRGGEERAGPTLTLLFDPDSPWRGRIGRAVLFYRKPDDAPRGHEDEAVAQSLRREIDRMAGRRRIDVELVPWHGDDPTDHRGLFEFLDPVVTRVRGEAPRAPLVIHISPGTPAMQTVWVLMAEIGLVPEPMTVVKSLPRAFRAGREAVVPVRLDVPTFYKAFRQARPRHVASPEDAVQVDPPRLVSPALQQLYADAARYARLNVPILILGERGTGKTTLASWIRSQSPFRQEAKDRSWPSVPCSQYSPETMRAELFGYVRGAFTDAREDTPGLLHAADGDTLFLDEIGDISRDLQRLLIRALEEKTFTRVGARVPERSDFRLLSATNLPWGQLAERLDPDFLDRISPFVLTVPPLRAVRDDLGTLWGQVFDRACRRAGYDPARLGVGDDAHARVMDALRRHPLPGNLRDLFRVAYHLVAARVDDGEGDVRGAVDAALAAGLATPGAGAPEDGLPEAVARAFAHREPLDGVVGDALPTRDVERALRRFLAEEIRRIARARGVRPQEICDVTDRTLQQWVKL